MSLRPTTTAFAPVELDVVLGEQRHDPDRRRRHERRPAEVELPGVERMQAVDVLRRIDRADDARLVEVVRQRQLHEDAVDRRRRRSAPRSRSSSSSSRRLRRQPDVRRLDADLLRRLVLAADVDLATPRRRRRGSSPARARRAAATSSLTSARTRSASALPSMHRRHGRDVSLCPPVETEQLAPERRAERPQRVRGRPPLLRAREARGVAGARHAVERPPADPGVQGLAAEARAPARPLALGDHAAAPGRHVRRADGGAAPQRRAASRGAALLLDDGAGRGAPHRGVAQARSTRRAARPSATRTSTSSRRCSSTSTRSRRRSS